MEYKKHIINSIERIIKRIMESIALNEPTLKLFSERINDPIWKDDKDMLEVNEMAIILDFTLKAELSALRLSIKHINNVKDDNPKTCIFEGRDTITTALFTAEKHRRLFAKNYQVAYRGTSGYDTLIKKYSKFTGMVNGFAMAITCFHVTPDFNKEIPF